MTNILLVDDEFSMRNMLRMSLEKNGYRVFDAESGRSALVILKKENIHIVVSDIRMPDLDGLSLLQELEKEREARPDPLFTIMMSAYGTIELAIECMKKGAFDYISKPFKPDELVLLIKKAEEYIKLNRENRDLKLALKKSRERTEIIFASEKMRRLLEVVGRVALTDSTVLITGETGTGKELIARRVHAFSKRSAKPFLALNCGAIPDALVESELFGHAKGAFTGANRARKGFFEEADGGTLFLDEIAELPIELQPKLLRVLQEGEFTRVGETKPIRCDVRLLAATAKDLAGEVERGAFRDDLYFRLNVLEIVIPPLRERVDDIEPIARNIVEKLALREGVRAPDIGKEFLAPLLGYPWPGNVRELENVIEKSMIFSGFSDLDIPPVLSPRKERLQGEDLSLKKAIPRIEREYIERALEETGGNRTKAAKVLEISLRNLMYKLKEYEL